MIQDMLFFIFGVYWVYLATLILCKNVDSFCNINHVPCSPKVMLARIAHGG